jgi:NADH:ubiquinone oxidoreductase subunit E
VADLLGLSDAYVRGVATFYTMYNKRAVGRFLIQVCTNISCNLCGGDEVLAAFLEHTGTELGETSQDGLFTVMEVECLAACGFPTAVQINSRYYENVTPEDVPAILADSGKRELRWPIPTPTRRRSGSSPGASATPGPGRWRGGRPWGATRG